MQNVLVGVFFPLCIVSPQAELTEFLSCLPSQVSEVFTLLASISRILTGAGQRNACLSRHPATLSWWLTLLLPDNKSVR